MKVIISFFKIYLLAIILSANFLASVSAKTNDSKKIKDELPLPDRGITKSSILKNYVLSESNSKETRNNKVLKKAKLIQKQKRNLVITHNAKVTGTACGSDSMTQTCAGGGYFYSIRNFSCGVGYSGGANNDCSVMQFSESNLATPTWQYYFGANGSTENCSGGCVADDSGVWILADSNATINGITAIGGNSAFVIKLSPTMTVKYTVRSNNYNSFTSTAGYHGIAQDHTNIFTTGRGNGGNNTYVCKLQKSNGTILFCSSIATLVSANSWVAGIDVSPLNGDIFFGISTNAGGYLTGTAAHTGYDTFLGRLNSSGTYLNAVATVGDNEDWGYGVKVDGLGNVYRHIHSASTLIHGVAKINGGAGRQEGVLSKYDSSLNHLATIRINSSGTQSQINNIHIDNINNYIMIGGYEQAPTCCVNFYGMAMNANDRGFFHAVYTTSLAQVHIFSWAATNSIFTNSASYSCSAGKYFITGVVPGGVSFFDSNNPPAQNGYWVYGSTGYTTTCSGGNYLNIFCVCVARTSCTNPEHVDWTNRICKYCEDYYENNICIAEASCSNPTLKNTSTKVCHICTALSSTFYYQGSCVATCTTSHSDITTRFCIDCIAPNDYLNAGACIPSSSCPNTFHLDTINKICLVCIAPNDYYDSNTCIPSSSCPNVLHLDAVNFICLVCTAPNDYYDSNACIASTSCANPMHLDTVNKVCLTCTAPNDYYNANSCLPSSSCPNVLHLDTVNFICLVCTAPNDYYNANACIPSSSCPNPLHIHTVSKVCLNCTAQNDYYHNNACVAKSSCPDPNNVNISQKLCAGVGNLSTPPSCSAPNDYKFNNTCVSLANCPNQNQINHSDKICFDCGSNYFNKFENKCTELSKCPNLNHADYSKKVCYKCSEYFYNDQCVSKSVCPNEYHINEDTKVCYLCNGLKDYFHNNECKSRESCHNQFHANFSKKICLDCPKYFYKDSCISVCPNMNTIDFTKKTCLECLESDYILDGVCVNKVQCPNQLHINDRYCFRCTGDKDYFHNGSCINKNKCLAYNTKDKLCKLCELYPNNYYLNGECVRFEDCPFQSDSNRNCLTTPPLQKENIQIDVPLNYAIPKVECNEGYYLDSSNVCILNKISMSNDCTGYMLEGVCVEKCPPDFELYEGKICRIIIKKPTCDMCKNIENCKISIFGEVKCKCSNGYIGNNCYSNASERNQISNSINYELSNLINSSNALNSEIVELRKKVDYYSDLPEDKIVVDSLIKNIDNVKRSDILDLYASVLIKDSNEVPQEAKTKVKKRIFEKTKEYIGKSINTTELFEGTNSSILYNGDSFKIALSDIHSLRSKIETRSNSLPYIDYSICEQELKKVGVLDQNEKMYSLNTVYSSKLVDNKFENKTSVSDSIKTEFVDSKMNVIDISACRTSKIKMKMFQPILNNKINTTLLDFMAKNNIDIFNTDAFYDKCVHVPFLNETDLTPQARRKVFTDNAECFKNSNYKGTDIFQYMECEFENMILNLDAEDDQSSFSNKILDNLLKSNWQLVFCYRTMFDRVKRNVAFFLTITIIGIVLIGMAIHSYWFNVNEKMSHIFKNDVNTLKISSVGSPNQIKPNVDKNANYNNEIKNLDKNLSINYDKISVIDIKNQNSHISKFVLKSDNTNFNSNYERSQNIFVGYPLSNDNNILKKEGDKRVINAFDENSHIENNSVWEMNNGEIAIGGLISNKKNHKGINGINEGKEDCDNGISANGLSQVKNEKYNRNGNEKSEQNQENQIDNNDFDDLEINKINPDKLTKADLDNLPMILQVKYDERGFWRYAWDYFKIKQDILNLFFETSILNPFFVRFISYIVRTIFEFALNSWFFSEDDIDQQRIDKMNGVFINFSYMMKNQLTSSIWPSLIGIIVISLSSLIIRPRRVFLEKYNEDMVDDEKMSQEQNLEKKLSAIETFKITMRFRYIIWIILMSIVFGFSSYFSICFCSVYKNTNTPWLISCLLSLLISGILIRVIMTFLISSVRELVKKYQNGFTERIFRITRFIAETIF